jgi:glutaryl-CoA dehydrogenase
MAKRNNVDMAINIAWGKTNIRAMGIIGDYSIMRHMMN